MYHYRRMESFDWLWTLPVILRTNSQLKTASWVYSNKLLSVRCSNNASFLRCFLVACNVQTSEGLRFFSTEILGASLLKGSWILQHLCSYKCFSVLAFCCADVMCCFLFIISSGFSSLDSTDNFARQRWHCCRIV